MIELLALLASVGKSGYTMLQKRTLGRGIDEYVTVWAIAIGALLSCLLLPFVPRGHIGLLVWGACLGSATAWVTADVFDAKALRALDVSLILPIYSLGLVFTGVAAWLVLGEVPTPLGLAGVALIVGGVYLVELRSLSPRDALLPFRALFSNRAVWLLLPAFALYSVSSVLDKVGVLSSGSPVVYNVMNHCVGMALFTLVFWKRIFAHRGAIRANIGTFAALGTINVGFSLMSVFMYQTMDVLYVAALLQLSVLFNVVGGCVLFKEEGLARKLAAGTLIVAGSALLLA